MSQSLFTSITGMTTAQTKIDVIANNIANMNTTAFKASNLTFSDMYSKNLSSGSSPTSGVGGTNPMQVGLGVALSGITTDVILVSAKEYLPMVSSPSKEGSCVIAVLENA